MKVFLRFWSYLANPLFVPALVALWYFLNVSFTDGTIIELKMYLILVLTAVLPMLIFAILKLLGVVKSIHLPHIKERRTPLAAYAILLLILIRGGFNDLTDLPLYYFFVGVLIATTVAFIMAIINYKLSLHMMALGGTIGFALMLHASIESPSVFSIAILFVLAGLTATSRLSMKAHKNHELLFGFFTGLIAQIMTGIYFL
ncbi:hypothetical protein FNJ87_08235 [Nonlabens mediterrranea]|uniref:Transmembrane protein n=1 Tax=Nonlabens mediterrranea TaxID=1419947 RepID=A0ABS0A6U9_9FLAO|nr:hypothetical transmembrane protein [Flavobacteria bacterium BBFL7]MBF4984312.1 hypothetical protein [Nonlabens mediterrranea]